MWEKYLGVLHIESHVGLGVLALCVLVLLLTNRQGTFSKYRNVTVGLGFFGLLFSIGNIILGDIWALVVLSMLIGMGFSMRTLLYDFVSMFYLVLEGTLKPQVWVEGEDFCGCFHNISWRCVLLMAPNGEQIRVPNRYFLQQPWSVTGSGRYRKSFSFWINEGTILSQLENKIVDWLMTSPWVGEFHSLHRDRSHPHLIIIEVSILHLEDEAQLQKALRRLIEGEGTGG